MELAIQFARNIVEEIRLLKDVNVYIFDAERINKNEKEKLKEEYLNFISNLEKIKPNINVLCVIIGIDKFLNEIDLNSEINETFKTLENRQNTNVVLVENVNKLKNYEYEQWFKNYISKDSGIWVGKGINNQYLMTINSDRREILNNCGSSYGYVIRQGNSYLVKLLGMKDSDDDNE